MDKIKKLRHCQSMYTPLRQ